MNSGRVTVRNDPRSGLPVVHLAGRPLTGPDPAASITRRLPDPTSLLPQTLILVISPLHGWELKSWQLQLDPSCAVLPLELDADIAAVCASALRLQLGSETALARSRDAALRRGEELIRRWALRRVRPLALSGASRLHAGAYSDIEAHLSEYIQRFWSNRGTEIRLHRRWMANLFRNLPLVHRPVDQLRGQLGKRVLLVGAGPALDAVAPTLRGARVPLVAIDTALPALAAAGVQPDVVIAMDGQLANARDFVPWKWDNLILIADLSTHPSILRRFPPDRRFVFLSRFSDTGIFHDPQLKAVLTGLRLLPARGSVAPAAVELLWHLMGVGEILCAGVDFWYQPPRSHARMSTIDRYVRRAASRLRHRDGYDRALKRPWRELRLANGSAVVGDAILADQADQMRALVQGLGVRLLRVDAPGLDVGAETLSEPQWQAWLAGASDAEAEAIAGRVTSPAIRDDALRADAQVRGRALDTLLQRLRAQEALLARPAGPVVLDAGLDLAWRDLPQWPLLERRAAWAALHRQRLLRAVRDMRRRLARILPTEP